MKIDVLDKGYIEVVDTLGDDLTPVNAARVSFGGRSDTFTEKDKRLSRFLIKHKHFSPFRHQHIMVIIKAPEFVLRQWYKHVVGIETTSTHATKALDSFLREQKLRAIETRASAETTLELSVVSPKRRINPFFLPQSLLLCLPFLLIAIREIWANNI